MAGYNGYIFDSKIVNISSNDFSIGKDYFSNVTTAPHLSPYIKVTK